MLIREDHMISDEAYKNGFNKKRLPTFSQMVEYSDGAFLPCSLLKNELHFGGGNWQIEYEFIADGDY